MNIFQKIFHLFQYGRPNRPITRASLDEEVFAYRERSYGSYELRKNQPWYLLTATGIVMSALMCAVFVPIHMGWVPQDSDTPSKKTLRKVKLTPLPLPPCQIKLLTPPPIPEPPLLVLSSPIPEPVNDEGTNSHPDINDFMIAEYEPRPLNIAEVVKQIGYPQIARDAGIVGTVVVRVLIDHEGNYLRHKVINQVHPILAREVEQHVSELRFEPAIQGGNPIAFWVNIPFNIYPLR